MKVAVCVKQILDPELPPSVFEIDPTLKRAKIGKHALVLDPYSSNALELALQLKDKDDSVQITALTFGSTKAEDILRKCLAVLVDEAIHIMNEQDVVTDTYATAKVLAATLKHTGPYDLILCGRQAGDWDAGLVGPVLGEMLSLPTVCFASKLEMTENGLKIERYVEGGTQVLEAQLPLVVTVTNDDSNVLRIAKARDVLKAHRKPIKRINPDELGISADELVKTLAYDEIESIFIPEQTIHCEIIDGEDVAEKVDILLSRLKEKKVF